MTNDDRGTAEIHGFSRPGAEPTPWPVAVAQIAAAETFWISTVRPARGLGFRKGDEFSQTTWRFTSAGR